MARIASLFESERTDMHTSIQRTIDMLNEYGPRFRRWRVAWSGGKDSTAVVTLLAWLVASGKVAAPVDGLEVLYADTRMELLPLVAVAASVQDELEARGIPVRVVMADIEKRFLPYILGRGVPPPNNNTMRWCTRQIKLDPMRAALERGGSADDPVLVLTGVRLGESAARDQRIAVACSTKGGTECGSAHFQGMAQTTDGGAKFFQPAGANGIATLAPIIHWRICHVWRWLCEWAPLPEYGEWDTELLANAYGGRDGDEAQEIGARTGCVGCPLASEDSALDAILKLPRWAYLAPLKELRQVYRWLREPRQRLRKAQEEVRKDGSWSKNAQRMGPITLEARLEAMNRILDIQRRVNDAAGTRPKLDILNTEEVQTITRLIAAGTWPDGWSGEEPRADTLIPGRFVVEDEDGQRVEEQLLLSWSAA